ncbi:MAG TPA: hypothetical protein VMM92_06390 [Thermoanaerobaculia bacterium]|nr:hypothetical protein [Thermoanaerobaculia bacterium]
MHRNLSRLALPALALLSLLAAFPARPASAEERSTPAHPDWLLGIPAPHPDTCTVWTRTDYYTDVTHTNHVGACTVTCFQATHGTAEPTFSGGGSCTGSSGTYTVDSSTACPGLCP